MSIRAALPLFLCSALVAETHWPSWRGPLANGVAPDANPPVEWSESKNVRWKVAVPGRGSSSPVIWGDQVFILTAIPAGEATGGGEDKPGQKQQFTVLSYDRNTGKELWRHSPRTQVPHEGHHKDHGFASASPVTDGEHLIVSFGSFGLYGYDMKGKLLWEKDLGDMRTRNSFGEGSSPAMSGTTVVVLWDHEGDDFIAAFDKRDGKELWRQKRDEPTGWCTPLVVTHGGKKQVVVNATNKVRSYDLATGEVLWECGGQTANAIPSAVASDERVFVMSGFRGNALKAITLGRTGDLTDTDAVAWSHNKSTPYVPSPLLYGDLLYFVANNNAMLSAFDTKTGKAQFEGERVEGVNGVYASPMGAADRVYLAGRDGNTAVFKRGPKPEIIAKNKLDDGFDASPAAVGNQLFLRGRESLYCIAN
jgi:outer membrane protein assembly factor BamB